VSSLGLLFLPSTHAPVPQRSSTLISMVRFERWGGLCSLGLVVIIECWGGLCSWGVKLGFGVFG
jgi:hypothetical protein